MDCKQTKYYTARPYVEAFKHRQVGEVGTTERRAQVSVALPPPPRKQAKEAVVQEEDVCSLSSDPVCGIRSQHVPGPLGHAVCSELHSQGASGAPRSGTGGFVFLSRGSVISKASLSQICIYILSDQVYEYRKQYF